MKIFLTPIYSLSNYLPNFKKFNAEKLFYDNSTITTATSSTDINNIYSENLECLYFEEKDYLTNFYRKIKISNSKFVYSKLLAYHLIHLFLKYTTVHYFTAENKKLMYNYKGFILIIPNSTILFINTNDQKQESNKEIFESNKKSIHTSIPISSIYLVTERTYYYEKNSIEIFTKLNKSHIFNFLNEKDKNDFLSILLKLVTLLSTGIKPLVVINLDDSEQIINKYVSNLNEESMFYYNNKSYISRIEKLKINLSCLKTFLMINLNDWKNNKISNFDLIIRLNYLSGRSLNDSMQYPVFPWICGKGKVRKNKNSDYEALISISNILSFKIFKELNFRDLSKPIGQCGSVRRKKMFNMNFQESTSEYNSIVTENNLEQSILSNGEYYYNSHYSTPIYVSSFLSRLIPFTFILIELQGSGFDVTNRQFFSIPEAFDNCMNHNTDLRELIPEFYSFPEFLTNFNKINFGNVELSKKNVETNFNNVFKDIYVNKLILESRQTSSNINNWIDLIFGVKQDGELAKKAKNLFWKHSYQSSMILNDLNKLNDDEIRKVMYTKLEFGITPNKILNEPCLKKVISNETGTGIIENLEKLYIIRASTDKKEITKNKKDQINNMAICIRVVEVNNSIELAVVFNNGIIQILR
jgi:hypothetical protein